MFQYQVSQIFYKPPNIRGWMNELKQVWMNLYLHQLKSNLWNSLVRICINFITCYLLFACLATLHYSQRQCILCSVLPISLSCLGFFFFFGFSFVTGTCWELCGLVLGQYKCLSNESPDEAKAHGDRLPWQGPVDFNTPQNTAGPPQPAHCLFSLVTRRIPLMVLLSFC